MLGLYYADKKRGLTRLDIDNAAQSLRYLIWDVTNAIAIPIDIFILATVRYVRSLEAFGRYRSCLPFVHEDGLERLAEKLRGDRVLTSYSVTTDDEMWKSTRKEICKTSSRYFLILFVNGSQNA